MQDRVRNDEEMIPNLKAWFRNAELETKRFCQHLGPDAVALRRQMIEQLGKQNAYVFFVMRNGEQHQCVTLDRDQIAAWQDYVNKVKEKGWYPDPTRVIVYHEPIPSPSRSRSRSRSRSSLGLGPKRKRPEVFTYGPKQKKSRDLPLDMLE